MWHPQATVLGAVWAHGLSGPVRGKLGTSNVAERRCHCPWGVLCGREVATTTIILDRDGSPSEKSRRWSAPGRRAPLPAEPVRPGTVLVMGADTALLLVQPGWTRRVAISAQSVLITPSPKDLLRSEA